MVVGSSSGENYISPFLGGGFLFCFFLGFFFIYIKSHFRFHNLFLTIYILSTVLVLSFFLFISILFISILSSNPTPPFFFSIDYYYYIYIDLVLFYFILLQLFIDYQSFHLFNPSSTTPPLPPHNYIHNFQCLQHW